jgi:hypothetical protein
MSNMGHSLVCAPFFMFVINKTLATTKDRLVIFDDQNRKYSDAARRVTILPLKTRLPAQLVPGMNRLYN